MAGRAWIAAFIALTVAVSAGCSAPDAPSRKGDAAKAVAAGDSPDQRWGSATAQGHVAGKSGNRTVPQSLRGKYPQKALSQKAVTRNKASVAESPVGEVTGFDRASSREVAAGRGASERVFQNADGTQTSELSTEPMNYRKPDGSWAPIDSSLTERGGDGWRNSADETGLSVASNADAAALVTMTMDAQHGLTYGLAGAAAVKGRAEGGAVVYQGVLPSVDLKLESLPQTVKETLVLHSASAATTFTFPLKLTGLTAKLDGRSVVLSDAAGAKRAVIPPGFMVDSAEAPARSDNVTYRLDGKALQVTVDAAWLRDPARKFPVMLDPTVGPPITGPGPSEMMSVGASSSDASPSALLVGKADGKDNASFLKYDLSRLQNYTIYGAALTLANFDAPSCRPRPFEVRPVTESWTAGSGYRYPGPAVGAPIAQPSFAYGYVPFGAAQSSCPPASEMVNLGQAGVNLTQRWVNGQQANNGLSLRTANSADWKRFGGVGANAPRLYVTYTPYNASYAIPQPVPKPAVLRNRDGVVKVTVTNKGAEAWTPSNYYLAYRVYNTATGDAVTQQRAASLPTNVARNGKITLDATIKRLVPGNYYVDFTMVRSGGAVFTDHQVPPGRIVLQVFDVEPVVQQVYPPNGYQAPTLTPLLWAKGVDVDATPGTLQYKFEICDKPATGTPTDCTNSGFSTKQSWVVPSGRLLWSKDYIWRAFTKDGAGGVSSAGDFVLTASVPQPEITSHIANAPYATQSTEYDAQVGNYRTAALDAAVATVGPELNLTRTYNSLDPRNDSAFGTGWSSRYDMKIAADDDGSGNVVVRYPDGQAVRFGKNNDSAGTYAAPPGRTTKLTYDSTGWTMIDKSGTKYLFGLMAAGVPNYVRQITDVTNRIVKIEYSSTGKVSKAYTYYSNFDTKDRTLTFSWVGNHIDLITTDAVDGTALSWKYNYTGDRLTSVCRPPSTDNCTVYDYSEGTHYRSAVVDSKPESFWRLGEKDPGVAGSEVAVNLGKDAGTHRNTTPGAPGAIAGSTDTATTFNGTSSYVELPSGTLKKSRDSAVEVWFKQSGSQTGGPIIGYQDKAVGTAAGTGNPILYTGMDGVLRGQFADGAIAPLAAFGDVRNNAWHHVVLSVMGNTQTLWLDGVKAGDKTGGTIEHTALGYNQIGAGSATSTSSWTGWGPTVQRFFGGSIDEVSVYSHPLGKAAVQAHYKEGRTAAAQLSKVTLPSGRVGAEITYDTALDRIKEYTDDNGGTWKIGSPLVYGNDNDLRRSVEVLDPANRSHLYEYDALAGRLLRTGSPLGLEIRDEDTGIPDPEPTPEPTPTCPQPDPQDPAFCTVIPPEAGGPVFVRHTLDGLAVRSFEYDDKGNQKRIVNENGDAVSMKYNDRGNVTERTTCRVRGQQCFTTYSTYKASPVDEFSSASDLATETRDGRSASESDNTYRTTYSYHRNGQLTAQTNPDGSSVRHSYTTGYEVAIGGGLFPIGLIASSTDAVGKTTSYLYYKSGDLAEVSSRGAAGQTVGPLTAFTYDVLGRKITEEVTSEAGAFETKYTYDADSRIKTVTKPATTNAIDGVKHQQRVENEYDPDGNITKVTISDLLGGDVPRVTSTEYNEYGQAVKVIDPEGGETTYAYDRFGNKVTEVDACGNRYDYAYTPANKQAEVRVRNWHSDPAGAPATGTGDYLVLHSYSYDFAGRLASDTDSMGRRLEYTYYGDDLLQKVVMKNYRDPATGTEREYVIQENTYDGAGFLIKEVEGNGTRVTTHTVDKAGKMTATAEDPGGLNRVNTFAYDSNGNVTTTTATGKSSNAEVFSTSVVDKVGYVYDDAGNMTRQTVTASDKTRVTTYTYDRRGLRTSQTDPRGNVTNFEYDEAGQLVKVTGAEITAENGGVAEKTRPTVITGYDTFGAQTAVRNPLGQESRTEYDKLGRPVKSIAPSYIPPGETAPITPTTTTAYDPIGNVATVTSPRGAQTRYLYDQLNRLVVRDDPGATNAERLTTSFTYTRTGQLLSTTDPTGARTESTYDDLERPTTTTQIERYPTAAVYTDKVAYDDAGNARSVTTPSGAASINAFDSLGQMIKTTSAAGVVEQFGYDYAGRQVREVDGLGRTTQRVYNQFGDQTVESDLKPGTGEVLRTQTFGYDANGNLVTATDPYSHTTTFEWDATDRLTKQIEPVSEQHSITTSFGYDKAGNRTRYTDGRGNITTFQYNNLGLNESVTEPSTDAHPAPTDRTWTVAYDGEANPVRLTAPGGVVRTRDYDISGRLKGETGAGAAAATTARILSYDAAGRLTAVSAPGGTNTYTYNDRGALLNASGPGGSANFGYNDDGQVTSRTDAAGTASFTYDKGRLRTMKDGLTGITQTLDYDAAGAVKTIDFGAGRVRTFGYDDYGHLKADTLVNASAEVIASAAYGYDLNGHVTRKTTVGTADAGENTYEYDWAGRLTAWAGSQGRVPYEWDDSGNRTKAGAKTAVYDERNRLLRDGDYTYAYSPRGTLTGRTSSGLTEPYSFDAFDRLVSAEGQNYTYDGLDRATSRNAIAFTFAGLGSDPVAYGSELYARGPADELLASQAGTVKRLAFTDAHGDVVAEIDPAATTASKPAGSTAYDPFGKATAEQSRTTRLGFQGDFTDPDTDQVNMGARWYQPGTGTFTSRDSVNYTGGDSILANRYVYGAGAPLDFNDPDGHWALPNWARKAVSAVSGAVSTAWSGVKAAASWVYSGVRAAWNWGVSAVKRLGSALMKGASWLYHKSGLDSVVNYVGNGLKTAFDWGKRQAVEVARQAYQAKVAVTKAAKKAIATAVKYTVLPVAKALAKPLLTGLSKVVSTTAKLAAAVVSVTVTAVTDPKKFAAALYKEATEAVGAGIETMSKAAAAVGEFAAQHQDAILEGLAIAGSIAAGIACTAATAGAAALACIAGSAALINLAKDAGQGDIKGWKDGLKSAAIGGATGLIGGSAGMIGARVVANVGGKGLAAVGGRILANAAEGGGADAATQYVTTGRVNLGSVAVSAGIGAATGGRRCGSNSFVAGTPVQLADGDEKPIEQVGVGDMVTATDPSTGETADRVVTDVIVGEGEKSLVEVTVDVDGAKGGETAKITATDGHPFWVANLDRWVEAKDLKQGYTFETADHRPAAVVTTRSWTELERVYNLTVDGTHTYYVLAGTTPVLVHNCGEREMTTVGRWMSSEEHQAMIDTGKLQAGSGGASTYVARPANPEAYRRQAAPGTRYVEFDVPCSCLKPAGEPGWAQIPGPNHPIYGPLADRRGVPRPQMPDATNIRWDGTVK